MAKPRRQWTAAEDALIGTDTDAAIGLRLGIPPATITDRRRELGRPPVGAKSPGWRRAVRTLLDAIEGYTGLPRPIVVAARAVRRMLSVNED